MYGRGLSVREVYEVDAVFLAVDSLGQLALLAVVNDDLIILTARYDVIAGRREVKTVDFIGVLAEHLGHLEAAYDVVHQFHGERRVTSAVDGTQIESAAAAVKRIPT